MKAPPRACVEESEIVTDYNDRYRTIEHATQQTVQHEIFGATFGSTGYTTVAQIDRLLQDLRLGNSDRVLEVGTGSGWPGLYIALRTGCKLVATDLPLAGLQVAERRAERERLSSRVWVALASGRALPFRRRSFDAIVHSDVMC